jgi:hypothetical protein
MSRRHIDDKPFEFSLGHFLEFTGKDPMVFALDEVSPDMGHKM